MTAIGAVLIIALIIAYFTPATIAMIRNDPNMVALLIADFFLGWTVIGWIIILVLACRHIPRPDPRPDPGSCNWCGQPVAAHDRDGRCLRASA